MEDEIKEALKLISSGKLPPRSMMDDLAGSAASLSILRAAAAESPVLARKIQRMMEATTERNIRAKGPKTTFENAIVETVTQGDTGLWDRIKSNYATEAASIDSDISGRSLFERLTTAAEVGVIAGTVIGTAGYLATKSYAGTTLARANLLNAVSGKDIALGKELLAASKAKDFKKIIELRFPGANVQFKADALADVKGDKNFQKQVLKFAKNAGKGITVHAGKGALLGAKKAAQAARILAAAATVGMYTGIAGGIIGGAVAYTTMPEVEAGMRKAAAGVRVAASETYKMVKEEAAEMVEAAMLLGDVQVIKAAKDFQKKALTKARDAAKATVEAADTLGQELIGAWGSAKDAAMATIATLDTASLTAAYDSAVASGRVAISSASASAKAVAQATAETYASAVATVAVATADVTAAVSSAASSAQTAVASAATATTAAATKAAKAATVAATAAIASAKEHSKAVAAKAAKAAAVALDKAASFWDAASSFVAESYSDVTDKAANLGKVWVESYTKDDGSKVKGFWRNLTGSGSDSATQDIAEGLSDMQNR